MNIGNQVQIDESTFDGQTVSVTIRGESRTLPAKISEFGITAGSIRILEGVVGKYETGAKSWPAVLQVCNDPANGKWVDAQFGFSSRIMKHQKRPTVFFS